MENLRLNKFAFLPLLLLIFVSSCSSPKQVFYFQNAPAVAKTASKPTPPEPVYTASTSLTLPDLPVTNLLNSNEEATAVKTMSKKELRKFVKQTLRDLKDSVRTSPAADKRVSVSANRDRLGQLQADVANVKNSVRVQKDAKKVTLDMKQPTTNLSQNEMILLGIAALLVLIILLSLPVLGTILGVVLALGIIALAVALLLGVIEINGFN